MTRACNDLPVRRRGDNHGAVNFQHPPFPWDKKQLQPLREALARELMPDQFKDDPDQLEAYGRDESDTGDYRADLVVLAQSTADVAKVLAAAQHHRVPVTPVAARSGKSGGSLPLYGGVSLSLERMNRIKEINLEDLIVVTEPGVITGDLMKAVDEKGLFYPPDPNSWEFCTIGGNIAENAGGPRALKYGVTRDYVLGLEWVTPKGEVLRVGKRTIKGVAGYDLCGLFVGSEGTLGIATEITLQVLPKPTVVKTALVTFRSVADAARAVTAVMAGGILPRTLELLDDVSLGALSGRGFQFPLGAGAAVLAEVDGNDEDAVFAELVRLGEKCDEQGALEVVAAQTEDQRERLWAGRRVLSTALRSLKPHKISEDIVVPRSRMAEVIEKLKAMGTEMNLTVATYGHAGDGNLHANILFDSPEERGKVEQAIVRMLELTVSVGGSITGEHGVGSAKRDYLSLEQSPTVLALQRQVKALFDPMGLLNPGKIFPSVG